MSTVTAPAPRPPRSPRSRPVTPIRLPNMHLRLTPPLSERPGADRINRFLGGPPFRAA